MLCRLLAVAAVFAAGTASGQPKPPSPIAAKTVTLGKAGTLAETVAEIATQTGLAFDLSGVDGSAAVKPELVATPFWQAVEALADQAGCFVSVQGSKVKFSKRPNGVGAVPSSVNGPFRVVLKKVVAKRDLEAAGTEYELHLEVQWEPRLPVYLIDAEPQATAAVGKAKFVAESPSVRTMPSGYSHPAVARLRNVPRDAKALDEVSGSFRLTAAEKVLKVEFKELTSDKPQEKTKEGVKVTLRPAERLDKRVRFAVDLEYPDGHPEFESFQSWSGGNTLRLFAPDDRAGKTTSKYNLVKDAGRVQQLEYYFDAAAVPADLSGWRVVYETPGPMSEQTVPFTLKTIPLP